MSSINFGKFTGNKRKKLPPEMDRSFLVGVSLKDLVKPSKINGLQAASKALLSTFYLRSFLVARSPYTGVARPKPPDTVRIWPVV